MASGFDPVSFASGVLEFTASLDRDQALGWLADYTRTVFLTGSPVELRARHQFGYVTPDGSMGWHGPAADADDEGPSRGLRVLDAPAPGVSTAHRKGVGPVHDLHVAVEGLRLREYLVHVHHTLAEASLAGCITPAADLRIHHVPVLSERPDARLPCYVRVTPTDRGGPELRAVTWLAPGR